MENLEAFVTIMVGLSIASERLVEIPKSLIGYLRTKRDDTKEESYRKLWIYLLGVIAGWINIVLMKDFLAGIFPQFTLTPLGIFGLGFLISGGSGGWNSTLSWILQVKEVKKQTAELESMKNEARRKGQLTVE